MASPMAVYASLSIISLGALAGMGVAVGSGVGMMMMHMEEQAAAAGGEAPKVAVKVAAHSVNEKARGFAASA